MQICGMTIYYNFHDDQSNYSRWTVQPSVLISFNVTDIRILHNDQCNDSRWTVQSLALISFNVTYVRILHNDQCNYSRWTVQLSVLNSFNVINKKTNTTGSCCLKIFNIHLKAFSCTAITAHKLLILVLYHCFCQVLIHLKTKTMDREWMKCLCVSGCQDLSLHPVSTCPCTCAPTSDANYFKSININ